MTLAYLFDSFPSPTETFLAREVEALRARGLSVEIWALHAGAGARTIETPPRALKLAGAARFWRRAGEQLAPQLRARGIAHVHAAWANHVAEIAGAAAQAAGLPWSFSAHAHDLWVGGGDLAAKLRAAQWATACTRAGERELKKFGANVIYAPHGLPLQGYPFQTWRGSPMRLLGVGRLIEKKGWADLIRVYNSMIIRDGPVELRIIGEGPQRATLQELLRGGAGLFRDTAPASVLMGALPHEAVVQTMSRWANCLVLPSRVDASGDRDGLANVLLEAAALGLPLVTTTAGAATDLVDEESGWLCAPDDAAALARTIARVWQDPDETRRRCHNARRRVESEFDVSRNVEILARAFGAAA